MVYTFFKVNGQPFKFQLQADLCDLWPLGSRRSLETRLSLPVKTSATQRSTKPILYFLSVALTTDWQLMTPEAPLSYKGGERSEVKVGFIPPS